ncbi:hypothetical protein [Mogibacterium timidum]|uniref:Phage replisome organizer, N-terminal domain protein n=1 Tax=Mogibacterium timidum ATCC 33093 TaxID=1401079 RepID=X8ISD6_9FIRM|nr:hypothetical protein [Mogibacterium timidum]EUC52094.1 phage replisome organizer, N-terminal domain protein [Mogibacterium timidum ATCC 33093]
MNRGTDDVFIWYYRMVFSFFTEERMRNMKHVPMYGYQFIVIFLELCGLATPTKGRITIQGYSPGEIAPIICKDIGEDAEITMLALKYFTQQELIEVWLENGSTIIHIPFLNDKIGRRNKESEKRQARRLQQMERKANMLALQAGLEARIQKCQTYGLFENVYLTDEEKNELDNLFCNSDEIIKRVGLEKKRTGTSDIVETDYDLCLKKGKQIGKERI